MPAKKTTKKPAKSSLNLAPAVAVKELSSVRDFIRYAVSRFNRADLFFGHGTFTPFDEAVFLVLEGLKLPIDQLEPYYDARLLPDEKKLLADLVEKRVTTRKPLAYLLNKPYLQGVPFYVDDRVIVPRSYIADLLFQDIAGESDGLSLISDPSRITRVLDLCTGSGCLAILASKLFPNAVSDAIDLSKDALAVARINVEMAGLEDIITLHHGDLFAPIHAKKYDLIITNPPYVEAELLVDMPKEYTYEPHMALAAGEDGFDIVHRILKEAPKHLTQDGAIICEIGYGKEILEGEYEHLPFLWLDTENSEGEVFWLTRDQMGVRA